MRTYLTMTGNRDVAHVPTRLYALATTLAIIIIGAASLAVASPALAGAALPAWSVRSVALPTGFSTEDTSRCQAAEKYCDAYAVTATNVGSAASEGTVTVRDQLPAGIVAVGKDDGREHEPGTSGTNGLSCSPIKPKLVTCRYEDGAVPPGGVIEYRVEVEAEEAAAEVGSVTNVVEVEGGGAATVVSGPPETVANSVNGALPVFGLQDLGAGVLGPEGAPFAQAGGHPSLVTTTLDYNTLLNGENDGPLDHFLAVADPKTEIVDLPMGLVGDPSAAAQCSEAAVVGTHNRPNKCPADTRVGFVDVESQGGGSEIIDLFNMPPETGYPAEFGFEFDETVVTLLPRLLPTQDGYVLSLAAAGLPRSQEIKVTGARVTFFGDPSEQDGGGSGEAFLRDPTDCGTGPLAASLEVDSWVDPGDWVGPDSPQGSPTDATMFEASPGKGVSGCSALTFEPGIQVTPESSEMDSPSGFEVSLRVPQTPNTVGNVATPDLKDAVVNLPVGVSLAPGGAHGLVACQASGPEGIEMGSRDALVDDDQVQEGEEEGPDGLAHPARGNCPNASQIGEAEIVTPLLTAPLHGQVYVAAPACGGANQPACTEASATNGELYGLYLEVEGFGVIVKLRGTVSADPVTGQLTTTFRENPQLPFSELKLKIKGGERAPLEQPQTCSPATTTTDLTPWSTPTTPDAHPSSSYGVAGCGASTPFAPVFSADSESAQAASTSAFTTTFTRGDGEANVAGVSVTLPKGLVGFLSEVPVCGEPAAAQGSCGEASLVGSTTVSVGAGADPFWEQGRVYLTGPYNGAPFGLSIVVPAAAGPFNLGNVVVRAAITIDPTTTAVTVTTGALPQMKDGVPLRLRTVNVLVNRPGFVLNPSNCEAQSVTGVIASTGGSMDDVSTPFAVEGCRGLAFKPSFTASTQGHASKADGASLDIKVSYPSSGEANIRSVKTELPLQLPSRLSTLQRACVAAVFEANPADCPAESVVGVAKASSPILPVMLTGPAYLVSHGNEKFPNLVIVLQGDGVRVNLVGDTDIKKGITSTTFKSVPDDPVSSFEVYLPEGKYSILGTYIPVKANYNLCGQKLVMPTVITGQNGAVVKQTTKIAVTGCAKSKPTTKKKKKKSRAKKSSRSARS
jgi:hypothetical protein